MGKIRQVRRFAKSGLLTDKINHPVLTTYDTGWFIELCFKTEAAFFSKYLNLQIK